MGRRQCSTMSGRKEVFGAPLARLYIAAGRMRPSSDEQVGRGQNWR